MFGINGAEFVVLLIVAVVVVGPERLPRYAEQLGTFVRSARGYLRDAKARVDEEIGAEVGDVDWSKLDPRQYDPRRIVREALLDDDPPPSRAMAHPTPPPPPERVAGPAPFDDEAT
ncbi:Sec-independent protein translocase TatB [Cellulosimicrobium terreum]|nr:Sec-independent protein translocase TatB [Cellulosimicrobium terreum]